jgi:electron transfer flavoprotein beta subunit
MEILVCVKRVPMVGGVISLTPDGQDIDTAMSGFTISPHEECAVEEGVRLVERYGGGVTVLTLGPRAAAEQLRSALALGAGCAILLETDGREWGPIATAAAIAGAARAQAAPYDLLLFGNEAADTGDYQVPVRVAHELGLPCVTGIKNIAVAGAAVRARREYGGVAETFEIALPAVISVKEGINLPRYPSLPGRLRAKRAVIGELRPVRDETGDGPAKQALRVPETARRRAEILGNGAEAVPGLVKLLEDLGIVP